jgi:hypothetical protein
MTVWVVRVVDGDEKEREALRRGVCITGWGDIPDFRIVQPSRGRRGRCLMLTRRACTKGAAPRRLESTPACSTD